MSSTLKEEAIQEWQEVPNFIFIPWQELKMRLYSLKTRHTNSQRLN